MKIIRIIIATSVLATTFWLIFWVVPTLGVFRSAPADPPVPENGFALVLFKQGKATDALSLIMVETGWRAIWQGWPLIIIGIMIGYPLGEHARRKFAIDMASKKAIQTSRDYANDAFNRELNAERMLKEAQTFHTEVPRLQKELTEAHKKIETMQFCEEDMLQNFADLRRRKESVEKELVKARAKIKRTTGKEQ